MHQEFYSSLTLRDPRRGSAHKSCLWEILGGDFLLSLRQVPRIIFLIHCVVQGRLLVMVVITPADLKSCFPHPQAIINSTVTPNMTFTKTSQKFGQWADSRANTVYGLGFASEQQLTQVGRDMSSDWHLCSCGGFTESRTSWSIR